MKRTVDNLLDQNRDLWSISPEATVFEALEALASHEIGAIVVVEDGALIGSCPNATTPARSNWWIGHLARHLFARS